MVDRGRRSRELELDRSGNARSNRLPKLWERVGRTNGSRPDLEIE